MLLSVSVSLFSVIASCAPTSSCGEVLDVMQAGKLTSTPEHVRNNDMDKYNHLTIDSTVADVVNNPAFKGFGHWHECRRMDCRSSEIPGKAYKYFR